MGPLPLDVQYASEVLFEAVQRRFSVDERWRHAVTLRKDIRDAINAGNPPKEHYRYVWLKEKAEALVGVLAQWGMEFDEAHPDDLSTILDLFDIVNTARRILLIQMRNLGMSVPEENVDQGD